MLVNNETSSVTVTSETVPLSEESQDITKETTASEEVTVESTSDTTEPEDSADLRILSFSEEMKIMALAFQKEHPEMQIEVEIINFSISQMSVANSLTTYLQSNKTPDVLVMDSTLLPDIMSIDMLDDLDSLRSKAEEMGTYPMVLEKGSSSDGVLHAISFQCSPGAMYYRRSLATEFFGTDNPNEIQTRFSDIDKLQESAEIIKKASNGSVYVPNWGVEYNLMINSVMTDDTGAVVSSISGDWACIPGPVSFDLGGTYLGAMKDAHHKEAAMEFIEFATLNETNLTNWATGVYTNEYLKEIDPTVGDDLSKPAEDFVSNAKVNEKIMADMGTGAKAEFLGNQNAYEVYHEVCSNMHILPAQIYDSAIQREFSYLLNYEYIPGAIDKKEFAQMLIESLAM
jgi:ABC-type glycerol-3-phosphate transport system substrate-binding protein